MRKILCLIICFATLLTVLVSPLQASAASEDMIAPCLDVANYANIRFKISNDTAKITAEYTASTATFVQARLTVKIQQSFLWIFWIDVGSELVGTSTDAFGENAMKIKKPSLLGKVPNTVRRMRFFILPFY